RQYQEQRQKQARQQAEIARSFQRMADGCQGLWALILPNVAGEVPALDQGRCRSIAAELLTVARALNADGRNGTVERLLTEANPAGFAGELLQLVIAGNEDALTAELNTLAELPVDLQRTAWLE